MTFWDGFLPEYKHILFSGGGLPFCPSPPIPGLFLLKIAFHIFWKVCLQILPLHVLSLWGMFLNCVKAWQLECFHPHNFQALLMQQPPSSILPTNRQKTFTIMWVLHFSFFITIKTVVVFFLSDYLIYRGVLYILYIWNCLVLCVHNCILLGH